MVKARNYVIFGAIGLFLLVFLMRDGNLLQITGGDRLEIDDCRGLTVEQCEDVARRNGLNESDIDLMDIQCDGAYCSSRVVNE